MQKMSDSASYFFQIVFANDCVFQKSGLVLAKLKSSIGVLHSFSDFSLE